MDISNFDCPQYVDFELYDFNQRNSDQDSSLISTSTSLRSMDTSLTEATKAECSEISVSEKSAEGISVSEESVDRSSMNFNQESNMSENYEVKRFGDNQSVSEEKRLLRPRKTVPKPFKFRTDNRMKKNPVDCCRSPEKDFAKTLRQGMALRSITNHITKVEPFKLASVKKRKHEDEYVPLAEQIQAFQKSSKQYHTFGKTYEPPKHWVPPSLAGAKSPDLQSRKRRRVVTALSQEEIEQKEIEEMKAYQFRARPVNPKIFEESSKVKLLPKRSTNLRKKSSKARPKNTKQSSENSTKYEFKARPIPKAILSGTTGLKEKQVIPVTEPKPPAFEVENRLQKRKIIEEEKKREQTIAEQENAKKKAAPKVAPKIVEVLQPTKPEPFSFQERDQERFLLKEKKIQQEIEKESKPFVFKAQLMPQPSPSALPAVPKKPATKVEPFNFALNDRTAKHISISSLSLSAENVSFKAQPATVLKKEPFVPEKLPKQAVEVHEFKLHTDKRAVERQQLKEVKDVEEEERMRLLLAQKAKEEEEEQAELLRLRSALVHQAQPIRHYKPIEVKPSDRPLTKPHSPDFETDKRLQKKHN